MTNVELTRMVEELAARLAYLEAKDPELVEQKQTRINGEIGRRREAEKRARERAAIEAEALAREERKKALRRAIKHAPAVELTIPPSNRRGSVSTDTKHPDPDPATVYPTPFRLIAGERRRYLVSFFVEMVERDPALHEACESGAIEVRAMTTTEVEADRELRRLAAVDAPPAAKAAVGPLRSRVTMRDFPGVE